MIITDKVMNKVKEFENELVLKVVMDITSPKQVNERVDDVTKFNALDTFEAFLQGLEFAELVDSNFIDEQVHYLRQSFNFHTRKELLELKR